VIPAKDEDSMESPRTRRWRAALRSAGATHLIGIPDSSTAELFRSPLTAADPKTGCSEPPPVITVCREGEAFAMAAGLWAGGTRPVVWMQSTGLFASGDSIRSVSQELLAPVPLVVGWRGRMGKPNAGQFDTATELLEPTLQAWRIPYVLAATPDANELAEWLASFNWNQPGIRALIVPQ
jgi:sulfopyruvate decarboxylase subunit alpha